MHQTLTGHPLKGQTLPDEPQVGTVVGASTEAWSQWTDTVLDMPLATLVDRPLYTSHLEDAWAILSPDHQRCELVVGDSMRLSDLRPAVSTMSNDGWDVTVLVSGPRAGEAHAALRGTRAVLQIYWMDDGAVKFGRPEVP